MIKQLKKVLQERGLKKAVKELNDSAALPNAQAVIQNEDTQTKCRLISATDLYRSSKGIKTKKGYGSVDGKVRMMTEAYLPTSEKNKS